MSNKLNQLLENVKHENPLLTENDVISVINNRSLLGKKQTFFTLKNILMMSVLSSIIIGLWIVFYPTVTTNLAEQTPITSPKNKEQITEKPEVNNLLANADNNTTTTTNATERSVQVVDSPKKLPAINNKPTTKLFDPIPFTPLFNENPIDDNRTYFDKDGYLILTNEELAKLGIITDGNVLKYENVTDTVIDVFENNNMIKKHTYFGVNISSEGGVSIDHDFKNNKEIINNSLNFWPAYITTKSIYYSKKRAIKKVSSFATVDWLFGFGYENNFTEEIAPLLIPVAVNLKSNNPGKLSTEYQIVFWFKTEQLFYNQLAENVAKAAKSDYGISNISQYKIILQKYRNKSRNGANPYGIDSVTSLSLQKRYIEPQQNQYKDLNIFKKKNFFSYKNYCKVDNKTKVLEAKIYNNETTILENYSRKESFNKLNSKILAVAITDLKIKNITYLKIYSDSVFFFEKMDIEEKYFRVNIQKLIPIKIDTEHVIWFEPTEELKRIINPNVNVFTSNKLNLIELSDNDLAKLNIYCMLGKIEMPMKLNSGKTMQVTYSEKGSSLEFDALTSDEYYKLPIEQRGDSTLFRFGDNIKQWLYQKKSKENTFPPLLITSEDGKSWLINSIKNNKDSLTESDYTIIKEHGLKTKDYPKAISIDIKYKNDILNRIKYYIPILVKAKTNDTIEPFNLIMWYEPTEVFFNSLPPEIANQIKTEYNAISNNLPAPSCKYFEVCQNVTGKINSYLAYPNPAEQTLNIEIDLAEERNLEFIITDITGKIIKTLNQNLKQAKGTQTYTYQIGELTEGMYLLIITTDKGEKVSTRIVKK